MNKIKIYTTPNCGYCRMVKDYFKIKEIQYEEYDVSVDRTKAEEMVAKSGQMGVPVIEINDSIVIGFQKKIIDNLINGKPAYD
jgi:glutaredoxin-like YruB-family protein